MCKITSTPENKDAGGPSLFFRTLDFKELQSHLQISSPEDISGEGSTSDGSSRLLPVLAEGQDSAHAEQRTDSADNDVRGANSVSESFIGNGELPTANHAEGMDVDGMETEESDTEASDAGSSSKACSVNVVTDAVESGGAEGAASAAVGSEIKFVGTFEELLEMLEELPFGSVVDLLGADVQSTGKVAATEAMACIGSCSMTEYCNESTRSEGGIDEATSNTSGEEGLRSACGALIGYRPLTSTMDTWSQEEEEEEEKEVVRSPAVTSVASVGAEAGVCAMQDDEGDEGGEAAQCSQAPALGAAAWCDSSRLGDIVAPTSLSLEVEGPKGEQTQSPRKRDVGSEASASEESREQDQLDVTCLDSSSVSSSGGRRLVRSWTPSALFRCRSKSAHSAAKGNARGDLDRSIRVPEPPVQWLLHRGRSPCSIPCFVLTTSGVTVRNGRITLPPDSCLVIQSSTALRFESVSFSGTGVDMRDRDGSAPLIRVEDSSVTLEDCMISGCQHGSGLGVLAAASVRMLKSKVLSNAVTGVQVSGPGSVLNASGCSFSQNAQDGVQARNAAAANLQECDVRCNGMLGISALDSGTLVTASRCHINVNGFHAVGTRGAALQLLKCELDSSRIAVLALACGKVDMEGCNAVECGYGVNVQSGAQVFMRDCQVLRCNMGALAAGSQTLLQLTGCVVLDSKAQCVEVEAGAHLRATDSNLIASKGVGVAVKHPQSHASLRGVRVGRHALVGAMASVLGHLTLHNSLFFGNGNAGIRSTDPGTRVDVHSCAMLQNGIIGAFVSKGAEMQLHDSQLSCNGSSGVEVRDRRSRLHAFDTTFDKNAKVGVYVHSAATASLKSGRVADSLACVLVGGRAETDMVGGLVVASPAMEFAGSVLTRHLGRICKALDETAEQGQLVEARAD